MTHTGNPEVISALLQCACFSSRNAARAMTAHYDKAMAASGLRITQFAILAGIRMAGSITMQSLAKHLQVDPSTLTRTLQPLEKSGYVRLEEGQDRRSREAVLTASGHRKVSEGAACWQRAQKSIEHKLGTTRFKRLLSDLAYLSNALET